MHILILLFLLVAPAACFAALLPRLDPAARVVVSGTAGIVILTLVAEVMLALSLWSPTGGLVAVAVICAVLLGVSWVLRHHGAPSRRSPRYEDHGSANPRE
ncbi:MAG: hypothetical protein ACRDOO_14985 [Actinomadura sp.]